MSDFFLRLAARSLESTPGALPRIASRFETPGWGRSPQAETGFAASSASEERASAPRVVVAALRKDGEARDASLPSEGMRLDGAATLSPSASRAFALDRGNMARKDDPHATASDGVSYDSSAAPDANEGGREAETFGSRRPGQLAHAPLAASPGAGQFMSAESQGPVASSRQTGRTSTAPPLMSRPWDEANNASDDIARVPPPRRDEAALARVAPKAGAHAPDPTRTAFDTHPAPEIHVTIGRIEVRAVTAPVTPSARPRPPIGAALSLEAYLRGRQEGSR